MSAHHAHHAHATGKGDHATHGHGHVHAPTDFGRAFAIGIALNLGFVAVEGGYGLASGSMALLADAGHNLSDVLGLVVAWTGATLARRRPSGRFTYGLGGSTILAALLNGLLLLLAVGAIMLEAIRRFGDPHPVAGYTVMALAGLGILVNGITAWLFARGRKGDINIRGAYLHMAADAAVSAGVVLAGLAIVLTGANWIDPLVSLVVAVVIFWGTWGLLRESVTMSLSAVPAGIDIDAVRRELSVLQGVTRVHDLHVWAMSTTEAALTAHLVIPTGYPGEDFLHQAQHRIEDRFGIRHTTLQIETAGAECHQGMERCD
jgi:cobalt-zinc-cadmium efflux system protein